MKETGGLRNQLRAVRMRLNMSQQELAQAARVARQTIGGIEADLYAPSAAVALRIARALGCRVEELFWLDEQGPTVSASVSHSSGFCVGGRALLARIGDRWVAHSLDGDAAFRSELTPADAVVAGTSDDGSVEVRLLDEPERVARTIVIAGCTPALSLWARSVERWHPGFRVHWMYANSTDALTMLASGKVHAAGVHMCDPSRGWSNEHFVYQSLPDRAVTLVNLGIWEEGIITSPGNPRQIAGVTDLTRADVRIINREEGSGSRLMLDSALRDTGIDPGRIIGYDTVALTHAEVARRVAAGLADAGPGMQSIASIYGLDFTPIRKVRYDLAIPDEYLSDEPVRQLLTTLGHRWVRSQLEILCGYDTALTGQTVAVGVGKQQTIKMEPGRLSGA